LELFYPKVFVEIQGKVSELACIVPTLFHATHLKEMTEICAGKQAIFKGNKKSWRTTCDPTKASYLVDYRDNSRKQIYPSDDSCLPGDLVWFGTARDEGKIYSPCQFEFNYKRVLQAYQLSRGSDHKICYKAGGTLVYQKEVSHVVVVCSTTDKCYEPFPYIEEGSTTTKFFTLSNKYNLPRILINQYPNNSKSRHEHVILAFYLPSGMHLVLANEMNYAELKHIPHNYCLKSDKKNENCPDTNSESDIDKEIEVKWNHFR